MVQARRNFMTYSSILLGMLSFGTLSLQAAAPQRTTSEYIEDYMGDQFDPDGWL